MNAIVIQTANCLSLEADFSFPELTRMHGDFDSNAQQCTDHGHGRSLARYRFHQRRTQQREENSGCCTRSHCHLVANLLTLQG